MSYGCPRCGCDVYDECAFCTKLDENARLTTTLRTALDLLDLAISDEPCDLDHNQNCQAHMWFTWTEGRDECYNARARRFLDGDSE